MDDNREGETKVLIGCDNAHDVDVIREKLQLMAQSVRCLVVSLDVDRLEHLPLGFGLLSRLGSWTRSMTHTMPAISFWVLCQVYRQA